MYATPWWEDRDTEIPVQICTETYDDGLFNEEIPFDPPTLNAKTNAQRYLRVMQDFLEQICGV